MKSGDYFPGIIFAGIIFGAGDSFCRDSFAPGSPAAAPARAERVPTRIAAQVAQRPAESRRAERINTGLYVPALMGGVRAEVRRRPAGPSRPLPPPRGLFLPSAPGLFSARTGPAPPGCSHRVGDYFPGLFLGVILRRAAPESSAVAPPQSSRDAGIIFWLPSQKATPSAYWMAGTIRWCTLSGSVGGLPGIIPIIAIILAEVLP